MISWDEQLISDIQDIDNKCFNVMPVTITIKTDMGDNGERWFDCEVTTGILGDGLSLVEVIGAETLSELFEELNKKWDY